MDKEKNSDRPYADHKPSGCISPFTKSSQSPNEGAGFVKNDIHWKYSGFILQCAHGFWKYAQRCFQRFENPISWSLQYLWKYAQRCFQRFENPISWSLQYLRSPDMDIEVLPRSPWKSITLILCPGLLFISGAVLPIKLKARKDTIKQNEEEERQDKTKEVTSASYPTSLKRKPSGKATHSVSFSHGNCLQQIDGNFPKRKGLNSLTTERTETRPTVISLLLGFTLFASCFGSAAADLIPFQSVSNLCTTDLSILTDTCGLGKGKALHCVQNDEGELGIGCFSKIWVPEGKCPFYRKDFNVLDTRDCIANTSICPYGRAWYLSNEVYKYHGCLWLNSTNNLDMPTIPTGNCTTMRPPVADDEEHRCWDWIPAVVNAILSLVYVTFAAVLQILFCIHRKGQKVIRCILCGRNGQQESGNNDQESTPMTNCQTSL